MNEALPKFEEILTEKQARRFLKRWPEYLALAKRNAGAKRQIVEALGDLQEFIYLDIYPFFKKCLSHDDPVIRLGALDALEYLAIHSTRQARQNVNQAIFKILSSDENAIVRGGAARTIGYIASMHKSPKVLPILLTLVKNRGEANDVRVGAYQGILYLTHRITGEGFQPWKIQRDKSADDQVNWQWIKELEAPIEQVKTTSPYSKERGSKRSKTTKKSIVRPKRSIGRK